MSRYFQLIRAIRPLAHANIAPPILFGETLAYAISRQFSWRAAIAAHAFGLLAHVFIVTANDYADRDADAINDDYTAFSGGSRTLPNGELSPEAVASIALAAGGALLMLAGAMSWPIVGLAFATFGLMWAYSYRPLALSYRGGGEWLQGAGVGVVLPLVGVLSQSAPLTLAVLSSLVPIALLAVAGNILTALPDEAADRKVGKRTWPVLRGGANARRELLILIGAALVIAMVVLPISIEARLLTCAPGWLFSGFALWRIRATNRRQLIGFVVLAGAASTGSIVAWSAGFALS